MKRNLSDYLVALAVIVCSVVLLIALTVALSGWQLKKPSRTLQIDFSNIAGIKLHSEVRYAGAPAGRVIAVHSLSAEERAAMPNRQNAVRVTVAVNEDVPALPSDTVASLGSDTLLSEKFVALSGGTPASPPLAAGAIIQGAAGGLEQLLQNAGPLVEKANGLITNVDAMVATLKTDLAGLMAKVSGLLDSVQNLSTSGNALLTNNADTIKADLEKLQDVLKQAESAMQNANVFIGSANSFVGTTDEQLTARMKELSVVLQNLKVVATQAKAITETLGEKPSRVIWGGKANKLTPEATILKSSEPVPARAR